MNTKYLVDSVDELISYDARYNCVKVEPYNIHDTVEINDELYLQVDGYGGLVELSIKVSDIGFGSGYSFTSKYFINIAWAYDGDPLKDGLFSLSHNLNEVCLELVGNGAMRAYRKSYDVQKYNCPVHVKQILFKVLVDDGYKLINFPWLKISWSKIKLQFVLMIEYLRSHVIDDLAQVIKMMFLLLVDKTIPQYFGLFY